ncbi:MAG TPA: DUF4326 domain-containing protein [Devosiaceae bacterium]|nr:DUF4326 domain-containing protein [Devosiaceae bacterium]
MPWPQRITFQRRKGFDLQGTSRALNGLPAKMVTRPGKWGNPFEIAEIARRFNLDPKVAQQRAVALHRQWMEGSLDPALDPGRPPPPAAELIAELGGHNLSCWCRPGEPCHADLLIELANPAETGGRIER